MLETETFSNLDGFTFIHVRVKDSRRRSLHIITSKRVYYFDYPRGLFLKREGGKFFRWLKSKWDMSTQMSFETPELDEHIPVRSTTVEGILLDYSVDGDAFKRVRKALARDKEIEW